jgi:hypothetical protein
MNQMMDYTNDMNEELDHIGMHASIYYWHDKKALKTIIPASLTSKE